MAVETLPLSPIEADLESKLEQTVSYHSTIREFVGECVRKGMKNVYFVGAGGDAYRIISGLLPLASDGRHPGVPNSE